jgi:hypothetical protein
MRERKHAPDPGTSLRLGSSALRVALAEGLRDEDPDEDCAAAVRPIVAGGMEGKKSVASTTQLRVLNIV